MSTTTIPNTGRVPNTARNQTSVRIHQIVQKPMPQGEHSRLQGKLCAVINQVTEDQRSRMRSQVLYVWRRVSCSRCDCISVEQNSQNHPAGVSNRFFIHPDWSIEILSLNRTKLRVLGNLLHCSQHGTKLGWLLDPAERDILSSSRSGVQLLRGTTQLPILNGIPLQLTVEQVFDWLSF